MKELNELVELAEKADAVANLMDSVNPHTILAIAEAFRVLQQRAEAAEARMAELTQQQPIGWLNDAYLGRGVIDGEVGEEDQGPGYIPVYRHPFNDVPAPAINLAGLVPDELDEKSAWEKHKIRNGIATIWCKGFNACRAAIIRNIEETK